MSIIFWGILLFLLYRFIFGFLIPVIRASRQVKAKVREMQEQMNNQYNQQQASSASTNPNYSKASNSSSGKGDYIDFEEIK